MRKFNFLAGAGIGIALLVTAAPAAAEESKPASSGKLQIKPILDLRMRYEHVDQGPLEADAVTIRARAGAEAKFGNFTFLAEGEATVAPVNNYNAFPFKVNSNQFRPGYAVIADPQNLELNRLQLQYKSKTVGITLGRQRINLDDQRWVGSVGWRQNEQTFDAVRGEAKLGPVALDMTYSIGQRTVFGEDADQRTDIRGDFIFLGAGTKVGPVEGKLFSYLLDYHEDYFVANSSQTYGGYLAASIPVGKAKLSGRASYARQSDYGDNPYNYSTDYWSFESGVGIAGFNLVGGWEQLGSDNGRGLQTPMATLHKFNGWADVFLTTPKTGLQDAYVSLSKKFDGVKMLPGLNAAIVYHQFDSAKDNIDYGTEWDASLGFKVHRMNVLFKYANYNADEFATDTKKVWLQAEWSL